MNLHEVQYTSSKIKALEELKIEIKSVPVYAAISELKSKRIYALIVVIGGFDLILSSLYFLYLNLKREYCFRMLGDYYSTCIEASSGDIVILGPIRGLEEKALLIELSCKLPKEVFPKIESFKIYIIRPRAEIHYDLRLSSCKDETIATDSITQIIKFSSWEEGREHNYQKQHNAELPVPLRHMSSQYYLHIKIDGVWRTAKTFEAISSNASLQLCVKLAVGLQAKKMFSHRGSSFEGTTAHIA